MSSAMIQIPVDTDVLYNAERNSRSQGMSLVERLQQLIVGYAETQEDLDDLAALAEAKANDTGKRYTADEVDVMLS